MEKNHELKDLVKNFENYVVESSELYALRGLGTATVDQETGCNPDNRCDDCKEDNQL